MSTEFILVAISAVYAVVGVTALALCVAAGRDDDNLDLLREEHHDPPNPLPGAGDSRSPSRAPGSGDGLAEFDVELERVMWWWAR